MPRSPVVLKGVIRGKTIELDERSGLPDGQPVNVTVEPIAPSVNATEDPRDALRRAAGGWSDDPEGLEQFLDWNRQQRKVDRRDVPE